MPLDTTAQPMQHCFYCGLYQWFLDDDGTYKCAYCVQFGRVEDPATRVASP
jgi:hypothetical protein